VGSTGAPPGAETFAALERPLSVTTSNSTLDPSSSVRKPVELMADWWTKTSALPSSGAMKPKPFVESNHLTVPVTGKRAMMLLRPATYPTAAAAAATAPSHSPDHAGAEGRGPRVRISTKSASAASAAWSAGSAGAATRPRVMGRETTAETVVEGFVATNSCWWESPPRPTHRHAPATMRAPHRTAERGTVVGAMGGGEDRKKNLLLFVPPQCRFVFSLRLKLLHSLVMLPTDVFA